MTCNECIHETVCYRLDTVNYDCAEKCGDYLPQKSGKWIVDREIVNESGKPTIYHFTVRCSECGFKYANTTNYCPNCGAKMESEDKE